jgi:hypothetical protein
MRKTFLAAAALAAFLSFGAPVDRAAAMPVASPAALGASGLAPVEEVHWGWHHRYWGWHHRYWAWHRHHWWGWGWHRRWVAYPWWQGPRHYYAAGPYWGHPWGWGPYWSSGWAYHWWW